MYLHKHTLINKQTFNHSFDHVWTPPVGSSSGAIFSLWILLWDGSWNNAFMVCVWRSTLNGERLSWLWTISQCVFMCVREYVVGWGWGGGEVLLFYTGFPCFILHSFSKCWPTVGTVVMVSSLLLQQRPLSSFSVMNCKLPVFSSSCPLCFHVSASQICLFIKFVEPRNLRNSSHFRFLVCYKVTWQTSAYGENFVTNMEIDIDL